MRSRFLLATLTLVGCSYFQSASTADRGSSTVPKPSPAKTASSAIAVTSGSGLVKAMHDAFGGKYLKTLSFLQNNTRYTTTGQEQKSQWYEHIEIPGKLRIAFLPASQKSGMVQVDDRVASFDNGIRIDFRPSVNPLLLLTADVYAAPVPAIIRSLDSLKVDMDVIRSDQWDGHPVWVLGAKAGDSTSNQAWVDKDRMLLLRFIQRSGSGDHTMVSDHRILNYKEIQGFQVPTEFLVIRNGRPVWREQYADIRVNEEFPPNTFDQAKWYDIPIPK